MKTLSAYQAIAREHVPHGQRGKWAREAYERARSRLEYPRDPMFHRPSLEKRFEAHLLKVFDLEDVGIITDKHGKMEPLRLVDRDGGYYLFRATGYRYYTSRESWYTEIAYVAGFDEGEPWSERIPGRFTTVNLALGWLRPAPVDRALVEGKRIYRQGDVWAVECVRADGAGADDLPESHAWNPETRELTHTGHHSAIKIEHPVRFYVGRKSTGRQAGVWD